MGREADGICDRSKTDFAFTDDREEMAFDNKAITNFDTVDCNDDIDGDHNDGDDDIHIDNSVDNNGQIDESIIILDDDDSTGDNEINNDDSRFDEDESQVVDVDSNVDGSDDCDIDTESSDYGNGHDNVNSVDIGGNIDAHDDDDDDKASFDRSDDGDNCTNGNDHVNHNDDADDVHSDADASDDNNVENAILDNSNDAIDNRFSDDDGDDCDNRDNEDVDDDIHIEDGVDGDGNIGDIIDGNGDASDNSVVDNGHGGIHDYNDAIDEIVCDDDGIIDDDVSVKDGGDSDGEDIYDDNGSVDSDSFVDDEDDGDDNSVDNHASYSGVHEPDCISNSPEIAEEMSTVVDYSMPLDITKNDKKVTEVKGENHPVEDCKIMHNTDGHSFNTQDLETSNELFNEEKTEVTNGTEINGESLFVEPYCHRFGIDNDHQDGGIGSFNDYISISDDNVDGSDDDDDDDDGVRYNDIVEEKDVATLANSADLIMDDNSDSAVISRPTSR